MTKRRRHPHATPRRAIPSTGRRTRISFVLVAALGLTATAVALAQAPASDRLQTPEALPLNTLVSADTTGATDEVDEPLTLGRGSFCPADDSERYSGATLWYRVTGTGGQINLSTEGSDINTILAVYDVASAPTESNLVSCSDDVSAADLTSRLSFTSLSGVDYLVQVGGARSCRPTPCGALGVAPATPPMGFIQLIASTPPAPIPPQPVPVPPVQLPPPPAQQPPARTVIRAQATIEIDTYSVVRGNRRSYLGLRVGRVVVEKLPAGTRVRMTCTRSACRKKSATAPASGRVAFRVRRNIRTGRSIVVRATKAGAIGSYVRFAILRNKYRVIQRCLNPGDPEPLPPRECR